MAKQYKLTRERANQLHEELEYLKTVREKEVADMIGISQSYISRLEKKIIKRLKRDLEKSI